MLLFFVLFVALFVFPTLVVEVPSIALVLDVDTSSLIVVAVGGMTI